MALATTDLASWDWLDPGDGKVDADGDDADDPEYGVVVGPIVSEDDGEDDTAQVTSGASQAGDDTVGVGVDVRHECEIGTVGSLEEEGHASDETDHCRAVVAVGDTDDDLEHTADDGQGVEPDLLAPDALGLAVDDISDNTTDGSEDDVEETEHGRPVSGALLAEVREVLEVVSTEDGVDRELGTESAEIAEGDHEGL